MSLPESSSDLADLRPPAVLADGSPELDPALLRLRAALEGLMTVAGEEHREQLRTRNRVYIFRGRLQTTPDEAHAALRGRFAPLGYTALLQRSHDEDSVIAVQGVIAERKIVTRWWLHLALLLITLVTTTIMGAGLTGMPAETAVRALREWDVPVLWPALRDGLPFSLTLLLILGVHEMGHYVAGRLHGVKVTLPFFIPLPIPGSLGTLGAVIFIRSPLLNRRALFDVGLSGPLAGMLVALPLFLYGLQAEPVVGPPRVLMDAGIYRVANPPLLDALAPLVVDVPNLDSYVFYRRPIALAAWFGVLLTALNLLPLGQFDGGHVAYALLGRRAWGLAVLTFAILFGLGMAGYWFAWLFWAIMGLLTGLRHPPPHDDITPLGWSRVLIGVGAAVLFSLIFVPVPFYAPTFLR